MSQPNLTRRIALSSCVLLFVSGCTSQWNGNVAEEEGGVLRDATVKPDEAIQKARAAVPSATILSAAIERENGALIYTFDMKVDGNEGIEEVHIDALTGAVLSNEHEDEATEEGAEADEKNEQAEEEDEGDEDEEHEQNEAAEVEGRWDGTVEETEDGLLDKAKVGPEAAIRAVLAAVPGGTIIGAEIENEDGKFIYSFDVRVEGKEGIDEVWVDAMTGGVIPIKDDQ